MDDRPITHSKNNSKSYNTVIDSFIGVYYSHLMALL